MNIQNFKLDDEELELLYVLLMITHGIIEYPKYYQKVNFENFINYGIFEENLRLKEDVLKELILNDFYKKFPGFKKWTAKHHIFQKYNVLINTVIMEYIKENLKTLPNTEDEYQIFKKKFLNEFGAFVNRLVIYDPNFEKINNFVNNSSLLEKYSDVVKIIKTMSKSEKIINGLKLLDKTVRVETGTFDKEKKWISFIFGKAINVNYKSKFIYLLMNEIYFDTKKLDGRNTETRLFETLIDFVYIEENKNLLLLEMLTVITIINTLQGELNNDISIAVNNFKKEHPDINLVKYSNIFVLDSKDDEISRDEFRNVILFVFAMNNMKHFSLNQLNQFLTNYVFNQQIFDKQIKKII